MGYYFQLAARDLLYAPSHRQDSTYHIFNYTSHGALAGMRNNSMSPPWRIDPMTHRTMSGCSTTELHRAATQMRCCVSDKQTNTNKYKQCFTWYQDIRVRFAFPSQTNISLDTDKQIQTNTNNVSPDTKTYGSDLPFPVRLISALTQTNKYKQIQTNTNNVSPDTKTYRSDLPFPVRLISALTQTNKYKQIQTMFHLIPRHTGQICLSQSD